MNEEWKPLFDVYEISNFGNVRRRLTRRRYKAGMEIKQFFFNGKNSKSRGYKKITITRDGKHTSFRVHTLVAQAFLGKKPDGYSINHKDMNKANNRIDNLEYVTQKQNMQHAVLNGAFKNFTPIAHVRQIRELHRKGVKQSDLSKLFNLSPCVVCEIVNKKTFKNIGD